MSQVTSLPHLNFISLDLKTRFVWGKKKVDSFGFLVICQNLR